MAILELQKNIECDAIAKMLTLEAIMYDVDISLKQIHQVIEDLQKG
jgi:hypothetical protein